MGVTSMPGWQGQPEGGDFAAFVTAAGPRLLRFGHSLTGSRADAEDLAQDTLVRVGLAWRRIRRGEDPWPYARKTMVNLFLTSRTKRQREYAANARSAAGSFDGVPVDADATALTTAKSLLAPLPPRQRAAVAMRYVLDLDDATIAAELGCSQATVRSQVSRALETLRSLAAMATDEERSPR